MATLPATISVPTTSTPTTRWEQAIKRLDPDVRASLAGVATRKIDILHLVVKAADEKRKICIAKQWKLKVSSGKVVVLRDVLEKIAGWVNRFVAVGDTIIQYDPIHAALPWAAFRFLLNVAVSDVQIWGGMLVNLETLSRLLYRCGVVENVHLKRTFSMVSHLEGAVVQLYVDVMGALAKLVKYFKQSTGERILSSAARSDHNLPEMTAVYAQEQEVLKWSALAESELSQATNTEAVSITHKLNTMARRLDADLPRLLDTSLAIHHSLDEKKLSKVLLWLSMVPTAQHLQEIATRRLPGSGEWLLNHKDFLGWRNSSSSAIFLLHGVRGCGKSTIASLVVHHFQLLPVQLGATAVPCAYFFCDTSNAEPGRGLCDSILRSIVRQLAVDSINGKIDTTVLSSYEKRLKEAEQARVEILKLNATECLTLLLDLTAINPAYILIDAVDQLRHDERAALIDTLQKLVDQSANVIKVFLTSSDNAHVDVLLTGAAKLRVLPGIVRKDVRAFATQQVQEANKRKRILNGAATAMLLGEIKEWLINGAGEMFLWVTLQLDFICRKKTEQDIVTTLGTGLTANLDQIYGRTLHHFQTLDPAATITVVQIFSFLLYAKRPLHPSALKYTLAINPTITGVGAVDLEDLCCNLVLLDMQQGIAQFCHPSVRAYMIQQDMFSANAAHQLLFGLCLRECTSGPSTSPFLGDESPVGDFYHYAAVYWPEHLRESEAAGLEQDEFETQVASFVAGRHDGFVSPAFITWMDWIGQVCRDLSPYHRTRNLFEATLSDSLSPLFVGCVFGLRALLVYVLEALPDVDINERSISGHTGIYLASSYGHKEVVDLLLDNNADTVLECGVFGTLARVACFRGHLNVVQSLLKRIDELKSPDSLFRAYRAACLGGHADIALLLANRCTTGRSVDQHSNMLQEAIDAGLPTLVDWLTSPGTLKIWGLPNLTLNAQEGLVRTAIKQGQVSVLKSLLEKRPHLIQSLPKDCISIASLSSQLAMVEYLFSIGADPKEEGRFGCPLRSASLMGCEPVVRMLIGNGMDVTRCGAEGDALQAASMSGHVRVMELLIQAGANVNQPGKPRGTCLQAAAWYGQQGAVELLLLHGADMYQKGKSRDALHAAIESGHEETAKLFLVKGYQPPKGRSLPAASRGDHEGLRFANLNRPARLSLVGRERGRAGDHSNARRKGITESSGHEESSEGPSLHHYDDDSEGYDDNNDSDESASAAPDDDRFTVWAKNLELSVVAGDVNSIHYHLLRQESTVWGIIAAIETAATRGQLEVLSFLVTKGVSRRFLVDADFELTKAMKPAAEKGQNGALQVLGHASSWWVSQYLTEWTLPFNAAVKSGSIPCIKTLLQHHPDPSHSFIEEFCWVIESSFKLRHHEVTELLWLWLLTHGGVENEVNVTANASDETVPTASAEMVSFLKMHLSPKDRRIGRDSERSGVSKSLLVAATNTRDPKLLNLLLLKTATEDYLRSDELNKVLEKAFLSGCSRDVRQVDMLFSSNIGEDCFTHQQICLGIHNAAFAGKAKVISLLSQKIPGDALSVESRSLLYEAFLGASHQGSTDVVQTMLGLDSFWNGLGEANKKTILTRGLIAAVEHGHKKTAKLLLEKGADVHACVQEVPEPRSNGRQQSGPAAFLTGRLPPRFGPSARLHGNRQSYPGSISPLQAVLRGFQRVAAHEGSEFWNSSSLMKLSRDLESLLGTLIDLGCDPDDRGGSSMYPIQNAARWANERAIQILLDAGAAPNQVGDDGDEPERSRTQRPQREESSHPIFLACARPYCFSYAIVANLVKGGATLPRAGQGNLHPAVLSACLHAIRKLSPLSYRKPKDGWYESGAMPLEVARQLFSGGMRELLNEIFKQLPQQKADIPGFRDILIAASTAGDRVCVKLLLKHGVKHDGQYSTFDTPLGCAAQYGHIHIMKELIHAGADVDCHGFNYRPQDALVKAIIGGHTATVRLLVQHGAQRTRAQGRHFLLLAVRSGNLEMVDCLLQLGFPIDRGSDALLASCDAGCVDTVSKLLSAGACPNKPGEFESTSTPLYQACLHGHLAIVQVLLKHDADPNLTIKNTLGVPLVIAASKGHLEVVKALLANGANPDQTSAGPNRSLEGRPSHSDNWSISPTALDEASTKGHLEIVRVLLSHHANIMHVIARTCSGIWTPAKVNILELVLEMVSGRGDFEKIWKSAVSNRSLAHRDHFIELLLDYIAPTSEILVLAASCGSLPAVDRCLTRGIDPNIASQDGHLPLASAAHSLHKDVVQRLVSGGANVNALDIKRQTPLLATLDGFKTSLEAPLQKTAQSHHALNVQDIVSCLVEGGAHAICSDIAAGGVLEVAGSVGHTGVVSVLLAQQERSDAWMAGTQNCLFAALDKDHPDVVSLLLQRGADPYVTRLLQPNDPRAQFLPPPQTKAMIEQTPLEAACGKWNDCLMRTFLASVPELRIPPQVLSTAARAWLHQMGHMRANSSDLAIILDHDASLIVPDSVLEILTEDDEGHLLKQVLSRSRNGSRSRFQPKPLVPRAPTVVSRMRDAVQSRHYP